MASVLGMGLNCALGDSLDDCIAALKTDAAPCAAIDVDLFDEPLHVPYYRIRDGADPFDPDRVQRLLPPVIEAALDASRLSVTQRRDMPVLIGSSSFAVARSEAHYLAELHAQPDAAVPMPDVGFGPIGALAARVAGSHARITAWHTACTSAANALLAAERMLAAGRIEHALVVGVELANRTSLSGFSALQLLADAVRPFDATRTGIVLGEGIGAIVLGPPSHAASLHLAGGASNSDVYSVTTANPDGSRIADVQQRALRAAGRAPEDIRAIKAHATGTPSNDLGEARGMRRVFATLPPVCALKSRIGHTLGACGVTELALFGGALAAGFLPATPEFTQVDPLIDVRPLATVAPAVAGSYLLNQFGFGGSNTSLVVEYG